MTARISVTGNAVAAPVSRLTRNGRKVTNFRIGSTERWFNRATGTWDDGNRFFVSVACWGALADNVELSVKSGTPLIVTGRISQRSYDDAEGKTQFVYEIQAETVAPDLNRGRAEFERVSRQQGATMALGPDGLPPMGKSENPFEPLGGAASSAAAPTDGYDDLDPAEEPPADDEPGWDSPESEAAGVKVLVSHA